MDRCIDNNQVWALIPARGGSKSIPLKNLVQVGGRPLVEYVIAAARASKSVTRIICSTDHERIAAVCRDRGVEVHWRPRELSGDEVPVLDVLTHLLLDIKSREGVVTEIVCLLQPTSPFVLPEDIDDAVEELKRDGDADSVQTITNLPHNHHAYNQRIIEDGVVRFRFPVERQICYNKQTKPTHYIFGNLVVARTRTLLDRRHIFGERSLPRLIAQPYAADIDGPEDVEWAEWLLASKKVVLAHM